MILLTILSISSPIRAFAISAIELDCHETSDGTFKQHIQSLLGPVRALTGRVAARMEKSRLAALDPQGYLDTVEQTPDIDFSLFKIRQNAKHLQKRRVKRSMTIGRASSYIHEYTSPTLGSSHNTTGYSYGTINGALRRQPTAQLPLGIKEAASDLEQARKLMPLFDFDSKGPTVRVERLPEADVMAQYGTVGKVFKRKGFMSTSAVSTLSVGPWDTVHLVVVPAKDPADRDGRDIAHLSVFPLEREVLYGHDATFKVMGIESYESKSIFHGSKVHYVTLQELGPAPSLREISSPESLKNQPRSISGTGLLEPSPL